MKNTAYTLEWMDNDYEQFKDMAIMIGSAGSEEEPNCANITTSGGAKSDFLSVSVL
jgi:hypothetical protein